MPQDISSSYKSGYFETSNNHKLYYELWGNPKGKPVVFLHGGPGSGCDEKDKAYFDPNVWHVLFFDQRGAGKSTPFASLKHNTTTDLVEDIKKLMNHVGFTTALFLGGSWGSTLALCFAIAHPTMVTALIIRGVCTLTPEEFTYYLGGGTRELFPHAWQRFLSHVPNMQQTNPIAYYDEKITNGTAAEKNTFIYEFVRYELSLLLPNATQEEIDAFLAQDTSWKSMGPLEIHYMANNCFMPKNYIYNNLKTIQDIPLTIVQGKQDMIAPLFAAEKLHKALPKSTLVLTNAGHFGSDKENKLQVITTLKKYEALF